MNSQWNSGGRLHTPDSWYREPCIQVRYSLLEYETVLQLKLDCLLRYPWYSRLWIIQEMMAVDKEASLESRYRDYIESYFVEYLKKSVKYCPPDEPALSPLVAAIKEAWDSAFYLHGDDRRYLVLNCRPQSAGPGFSNRPQWNRHRKSVLNFSIGLSLPSMHDPIFWHNAGPLFFGRIFSELGLTSERRRIYLLATRIDRSASISAVPNRQRNRSQDLVSELLRGSLNGTFHHWSLFITRDDGRKEGSRLCELQASGGRVQFKVNDDPASAWDASEDRRLIGYTMCSNKLIEHEANQVLHSMPVIYNVMNNNCQTFCSRLFERIRHVTNSAELHAGRRTLHSDAFQRILKRRAVELMCRRTAAEPESNMMATQVVGMAPSSLNAALLVLFDVLMIIIMYWSYKQLSGWLYSLLMLALSLHSLYGNAGLFRHLQSIWRPDEGACDGDDFVSGLVAKHFACKNVGYLEDNYNLSDEGTMMIPGAWIT